MRVIKTVAEMRRARAKLKGSVGLVPTMGALHAGHMALVARAKRDTYNAVVSIFVNPTQFGPDEDFARYPRPIEKDLKLCRKAGVAIAFTPTTEEMYPHGESMRVDPGDIGRVLEGKSRPGHFLGVSTVVTKLFGIVRPDVAYFGEKDAQQVRVIRRINQDLALGVKVVAVPTVREPDGLALSSRNVYLRTQDRVVAPVLFRSLQAARGAWQRGERRGSALRQVALAVLAEVPDARVDYVSVADPETLAEIDIAKGPALVSMAVRIGRVRLIDNTTLE